MRLEGRAALQPPREGPKGRRLPAAAQGRSGARHTEGRRARLPTSRALNPVRMTQGSLQAPSSRLRGLDTRSRLTAVRGSEEGDWTEEGEGTSQRTDMHKPRTRTTGWRWQREGGVRGWVKESKMGTSIMVETIKIT